MLSQGQFDQASKALSRLPRTKMTIQWDDSKVPADFRAMYATARDSAIQEWQRVKPDLEITLASKGDIKISFEEVLPPAVDAVLPAGAVYFTSDNPNEPRIEGIIALKRDVPPMTIDPRHVSNEVGFAIGSFLGAARLPKPASFMGRVDSLLRLELRAGKGDVDIANLNISLINALKDAAAKHQKTEVQAPQMFLSPTILKHEPVPQGDIIPMSMEVTNRGNSTLYLSAVVDCGCVSAQVPPSVAPGQTSLIKVAVDSSRAIGKLDKYFIIYSNDPDKPEQKVTFDLWIEPGYRILKPNLGNDAMIPADGLKTDIYLTYDPAKPFKIKTLQVTGVKAVADYVEWEGALPDPELNVAPKSRKGYKISVLVSPTTKAGRWPLSIAIETDSKDYPVIYNTTYLQWGITAYPDKLYLGEIQTTGAVGYFTVSRPGQPFKIKGVASTDSNIVAKAEPTKNGEYRILVTLKGKLTPGNLTANIIVSTDDPNQPPIVVPLSAFVK